MTPDGNNFSYFPDFLIFVFNKNVKLRGWAPGLIVYVTALSPPAMLPVVARQIKVYWLLLAPASQIIPISHWNFCDML